MHSSQSDHNVAFKQGSREKLICKTTSLAQYWASVLLLGLYVQFGPYPVCAQHIKTTTATCSQGLPWKVKSMESLEHCSSVVVTYVNALSFLGSPELRADTSPESAASQTSGLNTAPLCASPGQGSPMEPAPTSHPKAMPLSLLCSSVIFLAKKFCSVSPQLPPLSHLAALHFHIHPQPLCCTTQ